MVSVTYAAQIYSGIMEVVEFETRGTCIQTSWANISAFDYSTLAHIQRKGKSFYETVQSMNAENILMTLLIILTHSAAFL